MLTEGEAFLTGSHAYGTPKATSDVDLVIRCTAHVRNILHRAAEIPVGKPLRFANLNVICCVSDQQRSDWHDATEDCITLRELFDRDIEHDEAKEHFLRYPNVLPGQSGKRN